MTSQQLREFLNRNSLTTQQFASVIGVTQMAVLNWLDGKRSISLTISRLCGLFDRNPSLIDAFKEESK